MNVPAPVLSLRRVCALIDVDRGRCLRCKRDALVSLNVHPVVHRRSVVESCVSPSVSFPPPTLSLSLSRNSPAHRVFRRVTQPEEREHRELVRRSAELLTVNREVTLLFKAPTGTTGAVSRALQMPRSWVHHLPPAPL